MGKTRHHKYGEDRIRKKIRKLEDELLEMNSEIGHSSRATPTPSPPRESPQPEPAQLEPPPGEVPPPNRENIEDDVMPEEYLLALGDERQEKKELGPAIRLELGSQWSTIMTVGLKKEAKEALTSKYKTPEFFLTAIAPMLNPEITVSLSEVSIK